jgi:single-stranded-DNA-specific exonuclease
MSKSILEELKSVLDSQASKLVKNKKLSDLPQPDEMLNLMEMAKQIFQRLLKGERCLIAGDYDADGVLATSILKGFFEDIGFGPLIGFLLPDRFKDGYGLSPNIVEYAIENCFDFIITVDNGISAVEAVALAKKAGIATYLTDHHTVPLDEQGAQILPEAELIVCPKQANETFPFIDISGATVAWYLTAAIVKNEGLIYDMSRWLDYVGISVITDVMPLTDINIAICNYAINKIQKKERYIYSLILKDFKVDETSFGFSLGPMLNAAGRIDNANFLVDLLTSKDKQEIEELFKKMFRLNEERKLISHRQTEEAMKMVNPNDKIIVVKGNFHEGVVGIIAGRLVEMFKKPAIVLSYNEKGILKGSARSFGNIHLYDLLFKVKDNFIGFGGHKGAAGMSMNIDNFDILIKDLNKESEKIPAIDWESVEAKPFMVKVSDITPEIVHLFESYAPFGLLNPKPRLQLSAKIEILRDMKNKLHWSVMAKDKTGSIESVFFNVGEKFIDAIDEKNRLEFTVEPQLVINKYTNQESIQIFGRLIY